VSLAGWRKAYRFTRSGLFLALPVASVFLTPALLGSRFASGRGAIVLFAILPAAWVATVVDRYLLFPTFAKLGSSMPLRVPFELAGPESPALPALQQGWASQQEAALATEGFELVARLAGLPGDPPSSTKRLTLLEHRAERTLALVYAGGARCGVELRTPTTPDEERVTSSEDRIDVSEPPPWTKTERYVDVPTADLVRIHRASLGERAPEAPYRDASAPAACPELARLDPLAYLSRHLARARDWHVKQGLILVDERRGLLRLTWRGAFRTARMYAPRAYASRRREALELGALRTREVLDAALR
jgi:hypothetical protein